MKKIPLQILVPVIVVILIAVGLTVFSTWSGGETTREVSTPESIVWNVPEGQIDPNTGEEIRKAIYDDPYLISAGKELQNQGEFFSIENAEVEGEWAVVDYATRYKETGEFVPAGPAILVLRKINERWEIADSKERLCEWFSLMPDTPFLNDLKGLYLYEGLCEEKK